METVKFVQCTPEELKEIVKQSVREIADQLPKRREKPYSKKEVKNLFECSYPSLMRWEQRGLLDRITVGSRVYYTVESVEKLYKTK